MKKLIQGIDYWEDLELREAVEFWKVSAETHLEALTEVSKKWNENKLLHWVRFSLELNKDKDNLHNIETKSWEKKISDKTAETEEVLGLLDRANEIAEKRWERIKELEKELEAKSELLDKANNKIEEKNKKLKDKDNKIEDLTRKLSSSVKEFHSLPKKSSNKIKALKTKIKTKVQQLIKKVKQQNQELVARVEVKVNK